MSVYATLTTLAGCIVPSPFQKYYTHIEMTHGISFYGRGKVYLIKSLSSDLIIWIKCKIRITWNNAKKFDIILHWNIPSIRVDLFAYSNGSGEDLSSCQIIFADLIWFSLRDVWVECLKLTKCLWKTVDNVKTDRRWMSGYRKNALKLICDIKQIFN